MATIIASTFAQALKSASQNPIIAPKGETMSAREAKATIATQVAVLGSNGITLNVVGREGIQKCHLAEHSKVQRYLPIKGMPGTDVCVSVPNAAMISDLIFIPASAYNTPGAWANVDKSQGQVGILYCKLSVRDSLNNDINITMRQRQVHQDVVAQVQQQRMAVAEAKQTTITVGAPVTVAAPAPAVKTAAKRATKPVAQFSAVSDMTWFTKLDAASQENLRKIAELLS